MAEMSAEEYARRAAADMSEEAFLQQVKAGARQLRRLTYHTRQIAQCPKCHGPTVCGRGCRNGVGKPQRGISMGSDPGFPDLVIPVPPTLYLAELKTVGGRLSAEQIVWLETLQACDRVQYRLWRPTDNAEIAQVLVGEAE